jgi:hypothetical protein
MGKEQILDLMQCWENVGCEGIVVGNGRFLRYGF